MLTGEKTWAVDETSRRSVLCAIGAGFLAGCTDQSTNGTSTSGNTRTIDPVSSTQTRPTTSSETPHIHYLEFSDTYTQSGEDFRVELPSIEARRTIEYLETPELRNIAFEESHVFLFVVVQVSGDPLPRSEFRMVGNETELQPTDRMGGALLSDIVMANEFERPYSERDSGGVLAFKVPTDSIEYSNVSLEMNGDDVVRWRLPENTIDEMNSQPEIDVENWEMPATIESDEPFNPSIRVRNSSDDPGIFHARIKPDHTDQAETIVEEETGPNTEEEIEIELVYPPNTFVTPPGQSTITYSLTWKNETYQRDVSLADWE